MKNTLIWVVFSSFKGEYVVLVIMNFIQAMLNLIGPLNINFLVDYVENGDNKLAAYTQFIDFTDSKYFSYFTGDRQYGIILAIVLVLSQGFAYILLENINFRQQMIGAKTTNSLIGLVYYK